MYVVTNGPVRGRQLPACLCVHFVSAQTENNTDILADYAMLSKVPVHHFAGTNVRPRCLAGSTLLLESRLTA